MIRKSLAPIFLLSFIIGLCGSGSGPTKTPTIFKAVVEYLQTHTKPSSNTTDSDRLVFSLSQDPGMLELINRLSCTLYQTPSPQILLLLSNKSPDSMFIWSEQGAAAHLITLQAKTSSDYLTRETPQAIIYQDRYTAQLDNDPIDSADFATPVILPEFPRHIATLEKLLLTQTAPDTTQDQAIVVFNTIAFVQKAETMKGLANSVFNVKIGSNDLGADHLILNDYLRDLWVFYFRLLLEGKANLLEKKSEEERIAYCEALAYMQLLSSQAGLKAKPHVPPSNQYHPDFLLTLSRLIDDTRRNGVDTPAGWTLATLFNRRWLSLSLTTKNLTCHQAEIISQLPAYISLQIEKLLEKGQLEMWERFSFGELSEILKRLEIGAQVDSNR